MKKVTCAVVIKVGNEFLVCHPTGAGWIKDWSLPKGVKDEGETEEQAAIREVFEETGIKLTGKLNFLGKGPYRPSKDLAMFETELSSKPSNLVCTSYFEPWGDGRKIKEVDKFAWITYNKAEEYLNKSLFNLFSHFTKEF